MSNTSNPALAADVGNDVDNAHDAMVRYNLMFPTEHERKLRCQVRYLPETDTPRLRDLYLRHIESLRLKDDGKPPVKLGSDFPPWFTLAKATMLAFGFAYCGNAGIWSVVKHIGIDQEQWTMPVLLWVINHELFHQAVSDLKARFPDNFALTSKERDEQVLDNLFNRMQFEKHPREYRALVKLWTTAKRDYDKKYGL